MSELLDYVSFQRRVCENQLKSYDKILNESHPKYKLLKEEYEFYLLMENIVKSLENKNVTSDQIEGATRILNLLIQDFNSSLSNLNEENILTGLFGGGHNIDDLAKEKSIKEFTTIYQTFKPLVTAAGIISGLFQKQDNQDYEITSKDFMSLKLGGPMGAKLTTLIKNSASSPNGLQNLRNAVEEIRQFNTAGSNPVLNFISNDLIENPINVGIKGSYGAAPLRGHGSNKQTGWVASFKDLEDQPQTQQQTQPEVQPQTQQQIQPEVEKQRGGIFRNIAKKLKIPGPVITSMVKSGTARWATQNPEQFKQLADQLLSAKSNGIINTLKESNDFISKFIENSEKQKKLVTEVVNKWNKLAGIK